MIRLTIACAATALLLTACSGDTSTTPTARGPEPMAPAAA